MLECLTSRSSKEMIVICQIRFTPKSVLNVSWLLQGPCFCQGVLGSQKKNRTLRRQGSTRHKMLCLETSFQRLQVYGSGSPFSRSFGALPRIDFLNWNTWRSSTIDITYKLRRPISCSCPLETNHVEIPN